MLVWLTDWQLAEDHLLISRGDAVDWTVYPSDSEFTALMFGERLAIEWQYDTYGDAAPGPSLSVVGTVTRLQRVRCRQQRTPDGIMPSRGEATLQSVEDTSGSWMRTTRGASGLPMTVSRDELVAFSYGSAEPEADAVYGYVASLAVRD